MLQIGRLDQISWASQTMPELVWWDVLSDRTSRHFASRVAKELALHFKGEGERKRWGAFLSDYANLSEENAAELRDHLAKAGVLIGLADGLADFLELYPECPLLRLVDLRPTGGIDIAYLDRFESRLRTLENKRSSAGVHIQAMVVYMAFAAGRLKVPRGSALANFTEVERYPNTEESLRVGAGICATVNMMASSALPQYSENCWVQHFWKRGLELRPLDFRHLTTQ